MKAMDLLKHLNGVDPAYVEEASDHGVLAYRRRQKRARLAAAACLAGIMVAGAVLAKPALHAWETLNVVTSWDDSLLSGAPKPSSSVYVSAALPERRRADAASPFTLSVGMGQTSDYAYATVTVRAEGFEITDQDGNTARDLYVRTFFGFDGEEFDVLRARGKDRGRVTGCKYFESFTFRYIGSEDAVDSGFIDVDLQCRGGGSDLMGDSVTVYYTLKDGELRFTDKRPAEGGLKGELTVDTAEPEEEAPTLSQEDISVSVRLERTVFTPFLYFGNCIDITASVLPHGESYPTESFTAELVYAETLREEDYSFFIQKPTQYTEDGHAIIPVPRVPTDAPSGAYDLRITDPDTGFVWVFENSACVLPELPNGEGIPAYEDYVCRAEEVTSPRAQGDDDWGFTELFTLTENGKDVSLLCRAHLEYAGDTGEAYTVTLMESAFSSGFFAPYFVPADAPAGHYDLVITHSIYGYTWRFENYIEVAANPDAALFGLYHSISEPLKISRSEETVCSFAAKVENRGRPFTVTDKARFAPEAILVRNGSEITLAPEAESATGAYEMTVGTGTTATRRFQILVYPDTPCGYYDLILSYGDCSVTFEDAVAVVP